MCISALYSKQLTNYTGLGDPITTKKTELFKATQTPYDLQSDCKQNTSQ